MLKHIEKGSIPDSFGKSVVLIYGAGHTGRLILKILQSEGVLVSSFVDDNEDIQGDFIDGIPVATCDEIKTKYHNADGETCVVLGTIYGRAVERKLSGISFASIYEMYDWCYGFSDLQREYQSSPEKRSLFADGARRLLDACADEQSYHCITGLTAFLDNNNYDALYRACSDEEQYFIPEVLCRLSNGIKVLDAGAFQGELLQSFKNHSLDFDKWYCFECDPANYEVLSQRKKEQS